MQELRPEARFPRDKGELSARHDYYVKEQDQKTYVKFQFDPVNSRDPPACAFFHTAICSKDEALSTAIALLSVVTRGSVNPIKRLALIVPSGKSESPEALQASYSWAELFSRALASQQTPVRLRQDLGESAKFVVERSLELNADMILVPAFDSTGKLPEQIMRRSPVPVVRLPSKAPTAQGLSLPLLFPTDLHQGAWRVLEILSALARQLRVPVTIFHEVPRPAGYALEVGEAPSGYRVSWDDDRKERQEVADDLVRRLRESDVRARVELSPPERPLLETLVELLKGGGYSLVGIGSTSGPIETYFTGLITRQLFIHAPTPVWAIHEGNLKKTALSGAA